MKNKMVKALVLASVVSVTATGLAGVAYAGDTTASAAGSEKKTEDKKTVDELAKKVKDADKAVTDTKPTYTEKKDALKTAKASKKAAEDKRTADVAELDELNTTKIAEAYEALWDAENDAFERRSNLRGKLYEEKKDESGNTVYQDEAHTRPVMVPKDANAANAVNTVEQTMIAYIDARDAALNESGVIAAKTEKRPWVYVDETPASNDDNTPASNDDNTPASNDDNTPVSNDDNTPASNDDNAPASNDDNTPAANSDDNPANGGDAADPVATAKAAYLKALEKAAEYETDPALKTFMSEETKARDAFEALLARRAELDAAVNGTTDKDGKPVEATDIKAIADADKAVTTAKAAYEEAKTAYEEALAALKAAKAAYDEAVKNTTVVYRLYNKVTREHLYSTSALEKKILVEGGWIDENYAWIAPKKSDDTIPVYRLYNKNTTDHHYTTDENEVKELVKRGDWTNDGPVFYAVKEGPVDVLRICNPNLPIGMHLFTTDKNEYETLYIKGWGVKEGNAFDVIATHDAYIEKTTNDPKKLAEELTAADAEVNTETGKG